MLTDTYTTRRHRRRRAENTHVKAIHVVVYTRVSTAAQNTLSRQLKRCEAYAKERGWTVVDRFDEIGSAFGPFEKNRPVFRKALARAVHEATQFDTVILVDDITRLSRHGPDADRLIATGIPFCVRGCSGPLGKGRLRDGIRAASKTSRNKSDAQRDANQTRDKDAKPRGGNLSNPIRVNGHETSSGRVRDNILRAAECLARQPDLPNMTLEQVALHLTNHGVRRVMSLKTLREEDWTVRELNRHWDTILAEIVRIQAQLGWPFEQGAV
ncbi:recombinase family protein [Mameliella alba]|uniref:Resolvase n=1 Tax=Mameliella alba TaxID=561184 RepID=A0A0B3SNN6_9RHOB|nr:recombinase family protein [Mameliella alba]KHQ52024.1 Resolvase [Mameliella alba]